ncbi:MAG TPA: hypothetical protein VFC67_09330 [Prolixibacteraceae bacterium]|nr:hypothetical protein [Prolixibacteraceae bacterium]
MSLLKLQNFIDSSEQLVYRDQLAVIRSFENKRGVYEIVVELDNAPTIFRKQSEEMISLWLENFKPAIIDVEECYELKVNPQVDEVKLPAKFSPRAEPAIYTENKQALINLSKALLEDIDKVRKDPTYVAQAKQICNSVNTIVSITKLQLQLLTKE